MPKCPCDLTDSAVGYYAASETDLDMAYNTDPASETLGTYSGAVARASVADATGGTVLSTTITGTGTDVSSPAYNYRNYVYHVTVAADTTMSVLLYQGTGVGSDSSPSNHITKFQLNTAGNSTVTATLPAIRLQQNAKLFIKSSAAGNVSAAVQLRHVVGSS